MKTFVRMVAVGLALASVAAGAQQKADATAGTSTQKQPAWDAPHLANPFIPGYYADASVLQLEKETYIYATEDPWGGETLGCWHSADFEHWQSCRLNWPTKQAATSPTSKDSMVWAPSVVRGKDGKFYMYISVGSEVWVGSADAPEGPWRNLLGTRPLIASNYRPGYHMIDAEVFQDTDGQVYLYWGSGLNWVNGHCFVVKLKADMVTFDGEPKDVTPEHYFEGPFMFKHEGRYFLMYSEGKTTDSSYTIRYAVGPTPYGPFKEGVNSPVITSDEANNILGPGHHAVFTRGGKSYIVYHRHSLPFDPSQVRRQLCIDELKFGPDGEMQRVVPTHAGADLVRHEPRAVRTLPAVARASSAADAVHSAERATDDNYATRWQPAANDAAPWIELDLVREQSVGRVELVLEYAWKSYHYEAESSTDGQVWQKVSEGVAEGTPLVIGKFPSARFVRLRFPRGAEEKVSVFEVAAYD